MSSTVRGYKLRTTDVDKIKRTGVESELRQDRAFGTSVLKLVVPIINILVLQIVGIRTGIRGRQVRLTNDNKIETVGILD